MRFSICDQRQDDRSVDVFMTFVANYLTAVIARIKRSAMSHLHPSYRVGRSPPWNDSSSRHHDGTIAMKKEDKEEKEPLRPLPLTKGH